MGLFLGVLTVLAMFVILFGIITKQASHIRRLQSANFLAQAEIRALESKLLEREVQS